MDENSDLNFAAANRQKVKILYKNYRGKTAVRTIIPLKIWFGSTDWHPESQWLFDVIDCEKNAIRSFALKDILSWNGAE